MEHWILVVSFAALLSGVFIFKKLWLGALLAILILLINKIALSQLNDFYFSIANGSIISLELGVLLLGAYLFYNILLSNNHFDGLQTVFSNYSSRFSVVLILCLFMGSFMEGIAGFGIPAMLIAPLMLATGFKPLTSIVLPLAATVSAVTFGALGTPLKIGLNVTSTDATSFNTICLNMIPAFITPFVLAFLYSKSEDIRMDYKKEWKLLAGAGACFAIPYFVTGYFNIEYPSVVAGAAGLLLFNLFFIPKKDITSLRWWYKLFWPYGLLVGLLVILKALSSQFSFTIHDQLRTINFFQPGIVFILTAIIVALIQSPSNAFMRILDQSKVTVVRIGQSLVTIFLLVCFTQIINSDFSGFMNAAFGNVKQQMLLAIIPVTGIAGSFITGSATMSNLLLNGWVQSTSSLSYLPVSMALLNTGGAVGNAISLQNIIMVKSVINTDESEGKVVRLNLMVVFAYLFFLIASMLAIVYLSGAY